MKSATVTFNVFLLLTLIIGLGTAYIVQFPVDSPVYIFLSVLTILASQAITFFSPSGEFVGSGQNWSVGKWITRIGTVVLSVFAALTEHKWAVALITFLTPLIEIIIRVYGSATEKQKIIARS